MKKLDIVDVSKHDSLAALSRTASQSRISLAKLLCRTEGDHKLRHLAAFLTAVELLF